jgi:hypothetical protein
VTSYLLHHLCLYASITSCVPELFFLFFFFFFFCLLLLPFLFYLSYLGICLSSLLTLSFVYHCACNFLCHGSYLLSVSPYSAIYDALLRIAFRLAFPTFWLMVSIMFLDYFPLHLLVSFSQKSMRIPYRCSLYRYIPSF